MKLFQRRRYLISGLQVRLLALNIFQVLVAVGAVIVAVFGPLVMKMRDASVPPTHKDEAASVLLDLHALVWPVLLPVVALLLLHSIFVSHRIAGPIFNFRRIFERISAGDLTTPVHIRKTDYLQNEARVLGRMVEGLRCRIEGIGEAGEEIRMHLLKLQEAVASGSTDRLERLVRDLRGETERLVARIECFQTGTAQKPSAPDGLDRVPPIVSPAWTAPAERDQLDQEIAG